MRVFVAIDRTSKVAFAELHPRAKRVVAAEFLQRVLEKLPYKAHTVKRPPCNTTIARQWLN